MASEVGVVGPADAGIVVRGRAVEPGTGVGRGLLADSDLTPRRVRELLDSATALKAAHRAGSESRRLAGRTIAVVFEKPSTRTRSAFDVAAAQEGARVSHLDPASIHLGVRESVRDTARVLGRLYDGIAYRGAHQATVEELGRYAGVPVWNALTDRWHPTQALADMLTIAESAAQPWSQVCLSFLGDGGSNVANSLRVTGALLGMTVRVISPPELTAPAEVTAAVSRICQVTGGMCVNTSDVEEGVRGADYVYTDTWIRIGEPVQRWRRRVARLLPYRVDAALLARTANPAVRYMHCLPAIHDATTEVGRQFHAETGLVGAEVTDEVFESPASLVFQQTENRMHAIKALLLADLAGPEPGIAAGRDGHPGHPGMERQ